MCSDNSGQHKSYLTESCNHVRVKEAWKNKNMLDNITLDSFNRYERTKGQLNLGNIEEKTVLHRVRVTL